jgi:hypothetical protein
MIDGGFQHQKSVSINGFLPENFTWVKGNQESDVEVFIDSAIKLNLNKPKEKKYAWIFESEKIFNIKWILDNVDTVSKSYEYIFTHNSKLLSLGRNFVFVPANSFWVLTPKIHKKDKLVSMIYSNKKQTEGHRKRLEIANKYGKYLDSYGLLLKMVNMMIILLKKY